ncbi:MAG: WXG100 family type VII secretion target [Nocardioides sp.]
MSPTAPDIGITNTSDGHALDGTFLAYDIQQTALALKNHDWASLALIGVADGLDTAATISDPFGSLLAAGAGWLMDHFEPLKGWLDDLTGDPGAVEAFSGQWEGVASSVDSSAEDLRVRVHTDLAHMQGDSIESYRGFVDRLAENVDAVKEGAEGMAGALRFAASMVEAVHGIVRDAIAQIVGSALSWLGEEVFSLGLATGWVIEQVSTRVASVSAHIGTTVTELVRSCHALEALVNQLDWAVGAVRSALDHLHPDVARGRHAAPWLHDHPGHLPGGGRHAGGSKGLGERLGDVASVEWPRNLPAEAGAAGSNYASGEDGPPEP